MIDSFASKTLKTLWLDVIFVDNKPVTNSTNSLCLNDLPQLQVFYIQGLSVHLQGLNDIQHHLRMLATLPIQFRTSDTTMTHGMYDTEDEAANEFYLLGGDLTEFNSDVWLLQLLRSDLHQFFKNLCHVKLLRYFDPHVKQPLNK